MKEVDESIIKNIPIGLIKPNWWNPNVVSEDTLEKIKFSIEIHGFVLPIIVFPSKKTPGSYIIIDGEHRWRLSKTMGFEEIPCLILNVGQKEARELTVVFNYMRGEADWDKYMDLVMYFRKSGWSEADLVKHLPLSRAEVEEMIAEMDKSLEDIDSEVEEIRKEQERAIKEDRTFMLTFGPFTRKEKDDIKDIVNDAEVFPETWTEPQIIYRLLILGYKRLSKGKEN